MPANGVLWPIDKECKRLVSFNLLSRAPAEAEHLGRRKLVLTVPMPGNNFISKSAFNVLHSNASSTPSLLHCSRVLDRVPVVVRSIA